MASTRDSLIDQAEALGFNRDSLRSLTTRNIKEAVKVAQGDRQELNEFVQKFQWGQLNTVRATAGRVEPKNKVIVTPAGAPRSNPTPFWTKPQLPGEGEGGGLTLLHPFQVTLEFDPDEEEWSATVFTGNLYNGLENWGNTTITGLGAPFTVVENDHIWLEATYDSGDIDTVEVNSGSSLPDRITSSGSPAVQDSWVTRIARVVSNGSGGLKVEQILFTHLTLLQRCVANVSIEYPYPMS